MFFFPKQSNVCNLTSSTIGDFFTASEQFPPLGHRFVSNVFLEDAQRTRWYIISRVRASFDTSVVRVMVAKSRRSWLYFGGHQFGKTRAGVYALYCRAFFTCGVCATVEIDRQVRAALQRTRLHIISISTGRIDLSHKQDNTAGATW